MNNYKSKNFLFLLISFSFVFIASVSIFSYFYSKDKGGIGLDGIISLGGGSDSVFYWNEISNYFWNSLYIPTETSIYVPMMAKLVKIVGILDPLVVKLINFTVYMAVIFLLVREMDLIFPNKKRRYSFMSIAVGLFVIYPSLLVNITSGIYRDIWIVLFMLIVTINYLQIIYKKTKLSIIKLLISIILLTLFRTYAGLWAIVSIFIVEIFFHLNKRNRKLLLFFMIFIFFMWYSFFRNINFPIVNMSLSDVFEYRGENEVVVLSGSDFYAPLNQQNFFLFIKNYIYSFLSNFIGPLVWQWKSFSTIVTGIIEGVPILIMLIIVFYNRKKIMKEDIIILIFMLTWIALISLSNDNLGTAARLRMYSIIQLIVLAVKKIFERKSIYDESFVS